MSYQGGEQSPPHHSVATLLYLRNTREGEVCDDVVGCPFPRNSDATATSLAIEHPFTASRLPTVSAVDNQVSPLCSYVRFCASALTPTREGKWGDCRSYSLLRRVESRVIVPGRRKHINFTLLKHGRNSPQFVKTLNVCFVFVYTSQGKAISQTGDLR